MNEWKIERWEDDEYIITGYGLQHTGTFSKREAEMILKILQQATPLIISDMKKSYDELYQRWYVDSGKSSKDTGKARSWLYSENCGR